MKFIFAIISVAVVSLVLVHLRRDETSIKHEIQRLEIRKVSLRRELWDRQMTYGHATAPVNIRPRTEQMALGLIDAGNEQLNLARTPNR